MRERRKLKKFTRRAGLVVLGLIALDLAAGAAAVAFGAELLGR
jgi:hypothetical protein